MYKEMSPDAMQPHDTWIIAFCPDTDSFFATNQRAFFWEFDKEFESEEAAIDYFDRFATYFVETEDAIMSHAVYGWEDVDESYLENTKKLYHRLV